MLRLLSNEHIQQIRLLNAYEPDENRIHSKMEQFHQHAAFIEQTEIGETKINLEIIVLKLFMLKLSIKNKNTTEKKNAFVTLVSQSRFKITHLNE